MTTSIFDNFHPTFALSLINTATNNGIQDWGISDKKTVKGAIRNCWNTIGFTHGHFTASQRSLREGEGH